MDEKTQNQIAETIENLLVEANVWGAVVNLYPSQNQPGVWQIEAHGSAKRIKDKLQQHGGFLVTEAVQDYLGDDKYALVRFRLRKAVPVESQYTDAAQLSMFRQARGVLAPSSEPAEVSIRSLRDGDATINGLESELVSLRHQYAEQSASLAQAQEDLAVMTKALTDVHQLLCKAGVAHEGTLTERVKLALARMQKAERRHRRAVKTAVMYRRRWKDACAEIDSEVMSEEEAYTALVEMLTDDEV